LSWYAGKCQRAKKKIYNNAAETTCCCLAPTAPIRKLANHVVYDPAFEKGICVIIVFRFHLLTKETRRWNLAISLSPSCDTPSPCLLRVCVCVRACVCVCVCVCLHVRVRAHMCACICVDG